MAATEDEIEEFLRGVEERNPHEAEFRQAIREVVGSVMPVYLERRDYRDAKILERITEPDRTVQFRVTWEDDDGDVHVHRGWRVQFNNAIGPYKGGLRFHPTVNQSVLKFLGFEQVLKNALTGLPMGGAKGGADFDPKGRSDREIMRFCQSLMIELHRHIGADVDVPAGDIGVGSKEVSYLFGQYKRLENRWTGALTGKDCSFGGSAVRTEATGWGCVYFLAEMLRRHDEAVEGKSIAISGSGNVALHAARKALAKGARVVTLSDSDGYVHFEAGLDEEQLAGIEKLKTERRGRLADWAEDATGAAFHADARPWGVACDVAMPCATQNELDGDDARELVKNGVIAVCEGSNMPTTAEAAARLRDEGVLHAPGKASNAGGVAVSGLEQSQNAMRLSWSREEVDDRLQQIMRDIHDRCVEHAPQGERVRYVDGANIAGFVRVADAMLAYGVA